MPASAVGVRPGGAAAQAAPSDSGGNGTAGQSAVGQSGAPSGAGAVKACLVKADGSVEDVRIVGSMLGRTYVRAAGGGIPDGPVRVHPDAKDCS